MKRFLIALLVLTFCLAAPALAEADLSVLGTAIVTLEPDQALLNLGYYAEQEDVAQAQAETAEALGRVLDALHALGIQDQDIQTSNLSMGPSYDYSSGSRKTVGYYVEHMLTITIKDISIVADVMSTALEAGANQCYGVSFSSTQTGEAYSQALQEAIHSAQRKAETMAEAAGLTLGKLEEMKEIQDYVSARGTTSVAYKEDMAAGLGSTIRSGSIEVTATVELIYELGR